MANPSASPMLLIGILLTESPESLATALASLDSNTCNNVCNRLDEIQKLLSLYKSGKADDLSREEEEIPDNDGKTPEPVEGSAVSEDGIDQNDETTSRTVEVPVESEPVDDSPSEPPKSDQDVTEVSDHSKSEKNSKSKKNSKSEKNSKSKLAEKVESESETADETADDDDKPEPVQESQVVSDDIVKEKARSPRSGADFKNKDIALDEWGSSDEEDHHDVPEDETLDSAVSVSVSDDEEGYMPESLVAPDQATPEAKESKPLKADVYVSDDDMSFMTANESATAIAEAHEATNKAEESKVEKVPAAAPDVEESGAQVTLSSDENIDKPVNEEIHHSETQEPMADAEDHVENSDYQDAIATSDKAIPESDGEQEKASSISESGEPRDALGVVPVPETEEPQEPQEEQRTMDGEGDEKKEEDDEKYKKDENDEKKEEDINDESSGLPSKVEEILPTAPQDPSKKDKKVKKDKKESKRFAASFSDLSYNHAKDKQVTKLSSASHSDLAYNHSPKKSPIQKLFSALSLSKRQVDQLKPSSGILDDDGPTLSPVKEKVAKKKSSIKAKLPKKQGANDKATGRMGDLLSPKNKKIKSTKKVKIVKDDKSDTASVDDSLLSAKSKKGKSSKKLKIAKEEDPKDDLDDFSDALKESLLGAFFDQTSPVKKPGSKSSITKPKSVKIKAEFETPKSTRKMKGISASTSIGSESSAKKKKTPKKVKKESAAPEEGGWTNPFSL